MTVGSMTRSQLASHTDDILTCVHCGFCLPACPTYQVLGDENDSPRGRLYLMLAVAEGRLTASDPVFALHIDQCLGCRACEPVCPSGVRYGFLLEQARDARAAAGGGMDRLARLALNFFFTRPRLQNLLWAAARLFRATRIPRLLARIGSTEGRPSRIRFAMAMLAATEPQLGATAPPGAVERVSGASEESVALLEGCVMSGLFGHVNRATERVVKASGASTAAVPPGVCCGALHAHAGELETARMLARRLIDNFEALDTQFLITNSAGCGAALKEYGEWLRDDPAYADRALDFSARVRDISEWLAAAQVAYPTPFDARVGYDAACHLLHAQGLAELPLRLLAGVPGVEVEPLARSERCCGGAGIYGLTQRRLSHQLLQLKLEEVRESDVEWVATGNPGCLMQIGAGALIQGLQVQVIHPVELLDPLLDRQTSPV